jgi:hypothetical protein
MLDLNIAVALAQHQCDTCVFFLTFQASGTPEHAELLSQLT